MRTRTKKLNTKTLKNGNPRFEKVFGKEPAGDNSATVLSAADKKTELQNELDNLKKITKTTKNTLSAA